MQDKKDLNLFAAQGVACRKVVMAAGHGRPDFPVRRQAGGGVIESKPEGTT